MGNSGSCVGELRNRKSNPILNHMDTQNTQLAHAQPQMLATIKPHTPDVGQMLQAVIDKGVSAENVGALEKLVDLFERMEQRNAEKEFASAFVALQSEIPAVAMTKAVPGNDGRIRYNFAPYEEIMETVRPFLLKHGFTVSFSMSYEDGRITQECTLQHTGGHSRKNKFTCRIGKGPPGSSEAQGDGAASTYAKRFALCNALNIVCEIDEDGKHDAKNVGAPIAPDKIMFLREQLKEAKGDESAFLRFAQVTKFEDIGSNDYPRLLAAVQSKLKKV